jgi:hypothetical protein
MENLKINIYTVSKLAVFDFSSLVKVGWADSRHEAPLKFTEILQINLGSILSLGTRNPVHR